MRKSILFYGNCQVSAIRHALAPELAGLGFAAIYQASFVAPGVPDRGPTPEELAACVLVLEQIDQKRLAFPEHLPSACPTLRFAALDTNLLWPFAAVNPYHEPGPDGVGDHLYGDRILLRCVEKGMSPDAIVAYYLTRYDEYRVDLRRVEALDRTRRRARDANADIPMADLVDDLLDVQLFVSNRHPSTTLVNRQVRRIAAAAAGVLPELAPLDRDRTETELFNAGFPWPAIPLHAGVASELGLRWYDPDAVYLQPDGSYMSQTAWVRSFVEHAIAARERLRERDAASWFDASGFHPPVEGALSVVGRVHGIYGDRFSGPLAEFELEATGPLTAIGVEAFYPVHHEGPGSVTMTDGTARAEAVALPGARFQLWLERPIGAGERRWIRITCSRTLNMFERGFSDDNRDLGVVVLKLLGRDPRGLSLPSGAIPPRELPDEDDAARFDVAGLRLPIEGPLTVIGRVRGIYPDRFVAPAAEFHLEASAPLAAISVEAYYPKHHREAGTVAVDDGTTRSVATVRPGTSVQLWLERAIAAGGRTHISITCSETLNMFERGLSDDDRDLGVLLLRVCGRERRGLLRAFKRALKNGANALLGRTTETR